MNTLILKSGKEVDTSSDGFIGINHNLDIGGGYDSRITYVDCMLDYYTAADICEIADIAIARWQQLKAVAAKAATATK